MKGIENFSPLAFSGVFSPAREQSMLFVDYQGVTVPRLGFGTWRLTGAECIEGVREAIACGYRHIDTAEAYDNEEEVGEGLRLSGVPRHALFLVTKIWRDHMRAGELQASLTTSLKKLKTEYVDLLLLHWPVPEVPLEESLRALDEVRRAGMARLIGVSNFTVPLLTQAEQLLPGALACNQVEYHPFLSQAPMLDWLRGHSKFLTAYTPLARGRIFAVPEVQAMAEAHGRTPAQIGLRWLMQQERVAAIPKAAHREHMLANLAVFDFMLSEAEMARLNALARPDGRLINYSWAPAWDVA
jgi:2,5-diketo-D-gluconate reductase B